MNLLSLNPYNLLECKKVVDKFELKIRDKLGNHTVFDYEKCFNYVDAYKKYSPRGMLIVNFIPCASFYYLNYLINVKDDKIVDIGCGINFFKNILPNVIGIDSCQEADVNDFFDRTFSIGNTNQHKYAISIDALHFIPITDFYNRVLEFENIIQPGGRGYLAMNCARLVDNTNHNTLLKLFSTKQPTNNQLANYIDQEIRKLPLKFLVIDNLILDCYDEFIDGNIRLVFEKQGETA